MEVERLTYGPTGELVSRQVGGKLSFYVGEYMTVTASGQAGCVGTACVPQPATVAADYHVLLAGTRIASVLPSRTLFYYRSRQGTVVATSLAGGTVGAQYRYDPYGKLVVAHGETAANASELGYTNALRLSGNLWYLKARVYDAELKTFLTADSVDRYRYAYVWGDPANLSDPSGLAPVAFIRDGLLAEYHDDGRAGPATGTAYPFGRPNDWDSRGNGGQESPAAVSEDSRGKDGIALADVAKDLVDRFTANAAESAQYWSDKAEKTDNPGLKALYTTLGAVASLGDKEAIKDTSITLASAGTYSLAVRAAPALLTVSQAIHARWVASTAAAKATAAATAGPAIAGGAQRLLPAARYSPQNFASGQLEAHFSKHAKEWGEGNITLTAYIARARSLLGREVGGEILGAIRANGDVLRYNARTNEFAVGAADGTIRTLFRPGNGMTYWLEQVAP